MCTFSQPKETVLSALSACPELASCLSSTTSSLSQDWNCCHFITRSSSLQGTANQKSICGALWDTPSAHTLNLHQSITASDPVQAPAPQSKKINSHFWKLRFFFFPIQCNFIVNGLFIQLKALRSPHWEEQYSQDFLLMISGNTFALPQYFHFISYKSTQF